MSEWSKPQKGNAPRESAPDQAALLEFTMWRKFLPLYAGLIILSIFLLLGLGGPWLSAYNPNEQLDPVAAGDRPPLTRLHAIQMEHNRWRLAERVERTPQGLRIERLGRQESIPADQVLNLTATGVADQRIFWMGSDKFGRDVLSRWLHGARLSLMIGLLSISIALCLGVSIGTIAALSGRWVDQILMRLVDGLMTFPWIFLFITLSAIFSTGTWMLVILLGTTTWMSLARLTRAEILSIKERPFVEAARGLGAGPWRIFLQHLLPNVLPILLVAATLRVGSLILFEAALSFLGFGVQPPNPSWGNMVAEGSEAVLNTWWVATFPVIGLLATVISFNLVGDGLRDLLDPQFMEHNPEQT